MVSLELEMEMMKDMYNRLNESCTKLCLVHDYRMQETQHFSGSTGALTMPERICLDRCVAKYMRIHERMGAKLTDLANPKKPR